MKIAFADFTGTDYNVESAYQVPLGGSESACCYLVEALALQGHEVFLLNNSSIAGMSRGVMCLPWSKVSGQLLQSLEALIVLKFAVEGVQIRSSIGENTRLILWTQHAHNQPVMQQLQNPAQRDIYDGIAMVSDWQRDRFHQEFNIDITRSCVLRNAIAPAFGKLFPDSTPILAHKSKPPILAYTSTPFRGLDILLEVFPRIRKAVPGTRLKVFSSMKVYQFAQAADESEFGVLYRKCRETEGVEYIGSIPQPDLARELRSVTALAYPNTFSETSCIAVMEAMASGCFVVTSNLAALPETTAGFARLIPIEGGWEAYKNRFIEETVQVLRECTAADNTNAETHLRRQVNYVNSEYIWSVRARNWVEWLSSIQAKTATSADLQQQAYQYLIQGKYSQAVTFYEQAVEACPEVMSNYWHLGLTFLLQGQEAQAQATWMLPMMDADTEQVNLWTAEIVQVLQKEATRQEAMSDYQTAALIEQYILELTTNSP